MKKINTLLYGMLAFLSIAFTACDPLHGTKKELELSESTAKKTIDYTLISTDYKLLATTNPAYSSLSFANADSARKNIPTILNKKFFDYGDGSVGNITYTTGAISVKPADSTFANVSYTVTTADYTASAAVTGTTYKDYTDAQVLLYLTYKYPTSVANQLSLLTYNYYLSGVTPAGTATTDTFLYLNGVWTKLYTVSAAQYTAVGRGNYGNFTSADAASLPAWFNTLLKADAVVASSAKAGDVKYVSFKYYNNGNFQRVMALTFDGTNWVTTATTFKTLTFLKKNNTWIEDNTVYYTLVTADYVTISNGTNGSTAARANLNSYKNFNISTTGTTTWTDAEITAALIAFLKTKYTSATEGQVFQLTYYAYSGSYSYPVKTFTYTNGTFVIKN